MAIILNEYYKNYINNNYTFLDENKLQELKIEVERLINNNSKIILNFDGGFGYTINFLEMIITFLLDKFGNESILSNIEIISNDEPSISEYVYSLLENK